MRVEPRTVASAQGTVIVTDRVCLLGLPGSGKTSFLAAVFELIAHDDVPGALRLAALPADRLYLQTVHERWLRCEPALRTRDTGTPQAVQFDLATDGGEPRVIEVPDIAGGAVRSLWEERRWTNGLDDLAKAATGVMLFARSDDIVPPRRVQRVIDTEAIPQTRVAPSDDGEGDIPPFDPGEAPTQVKLVDVIQSVVAIRETSPLRLAIILSAWDLVDGEGVGPLDLVRLRLPLLWQYLIANPEAIQFHAIGISAQGGDFSDPEDAQRLLSIDPPSHRVLVVDGEKRSNDISLPLRWLWSSA
jgi:hypothetical protein